VTSLGTQMQNSSLDVPCPRCTYPIWVLWVEIEAGATVTCPACRCQVQLVDEEAKLRTLPREIERAIETALKGYQ
jgi:hypothetical protein